MWTGTRTAFFWVFGISAAIKLLTLVPDPVINRDGVFYISTARQIFAGHFREALAMYSAPAYPFLIAAVHTVVPGWVAAARLVSLSAAILVLIPLYLLSRRLFDREAAFWGCLAFAVLPFSNEAAIKVIRGPSFLFLFSWAVYFAARAADSPRPRFFMWAGLLSWAAVCFRVEGAVLLLYGLVFFSVLAIRAGEERRAFSGGLLTWALVCVLPVLLLFAVGGEKATSILRMESLMERLRHLTGHHILDNYQRIRARLKDLEQASPWPGGRENFGEIARRFMPLIYAVGVLHAFVKVLFPPFVLPLFRAFRRPFGRARHFVLLLAAAYLLMIYLRLMSVDFIQSRFLLAPAFLLFPWVGAGMARIFRIATRAVRPALVFTLLATLFFLLPLYRVLQYSQGHERVVMTAGHWLSARADLIHLPMITTDARIPFYAGKSDYTDWSVPVRDYLLLEREGISRGMKLLAVRTAIRKRGRLPEFRSYEKLKEFTGKEDMVILYRVRGEGEGLYRPGEATGTRIPSGKKR